MTCSCLIRENPSTKIGGVYVEITPWPTVWVQQRAGWVYVAPKHTEKRDSDPVCDLSP